VRSARLNGLEVKIERFREGAELEADLNQLKVAAPFSGNAFHVAKGGTGIFA